MKKVESMSTTELVAYQNLIGMSNEHLDQFATQLEGFVKEGSVPKSFYEDILNELQPKILKNNEYIDSIEKEIYNRVRKNMPGVTMPSALTRLYKRVRKSAEEFAKQNAKQEPEVDKSEKKSIDLKVT